MTQATVKVAFEVNKEKFEKIEAFVKNETMRNVSLQGYAINVERDDFTCIDSESGGDYTLIRLHHEIQEIIFG